MSNNMQGKIIKIVSNDFTVLANEQLYTCKARGKLRNDNLIPMVGDAVLFDSDKHYILDILPRKNALIRPFVANVDQIIIIVSCKEPELDLYLLDKLLCVIEYNNIKPIICFTKLDLLSDINPILELKKYYEKIGYMTFLNSETDKIKKVFKDKVSVFTGQSGAGKSTLLNRLNSDLNLNTANISKALGRGKHTTRHTELFNLLGGWCADTPGFSSLSLKEMSKEAIRDNMIEFNDYKEECEYKDCMHIKEEKCGIKNHLSQDILASRYVNYQKFLNEKEGLL